MVSKAKLQRDRRKKVIALVLKGMERGAIAEKYGITTRTLDSDIAAVKKEIAKRLDKMSKYERLSEYEETARMRTGKLWTIALDVKSKPAQIMRAVELLQREDVLKLRRDQLVGFFPKDVIMNLNQFNLLNADKIQIEFEDIVPEEDKVIDAEVVKEVDNGKEDSQD